MKFFYDIGIEEHDQEGRVITAEFENYFVVTVYTPNSGEGMKRLDYRETWDLAFREYIISLEEKKPVIICGDLNVAHTEIDIARSKRITIKLQVIHKGKLMDWKAYLMRGILIPLGTNFPMR